MTMPLPNHFLTHAEIAAVLGCDRAKVSRLARDYGGYLGGPDRSARPGGPAASLWGPQRSMTFVLAAMLHQAGAPARAAFMSTLAIRLPGSVEAWRARQDGGVDHLPALHDPSQPDAEEQTWIAWRHGETLRRIQAAEDVEISAAQVRACFESSEPGDTLMLDWKLIHGRLFKALFRAPKRDLGARWIA